MHFNKSQNDIVIYKNRIGNSKYVIKVKQNSTPVNISDMIK